MLLGKSRRRRCTGFAVVGVGVLYRGMPELGAHGGDKSGIGRSEEALTGSG